MNENPLRGLGTALRVLRERRGLTQAALGRDLGLSASMISRYETERVAISSEVLGRLLLGLETDFYRLAGTLRLVRQEPEPIKAVPEEMLQVARGVMAEAGHRSQEEISLRFLLAMARKVLEELEP